MATWERFTVQPIDVAVLHRALDLHQAARKIWPMLWSWPCWREWNWIPLMC